MFRNFKQGRSIQRMIWSNNSHLEAYDIENKLKLTTQPVKSRPIRVVSGVLPDLSKKTSRLILKNVFR